MSRTYPNPAMPRISRLTITVLATLGLILGLLAPSAQAAVAPTSLVVTPSVSSVTAGGSVTIASTLKRSGKPLKSVPVQLQRKLTGTSTWSVYKSGKTDSRGRYALKVTGNQKNYDYRAVYKGSTISKAAISKTATVKVKQAVSITKTSSTSPTAGDVIQLDGKTSPALVGSAVHLQVRSGTSWKTVASSKVSTKATYAVKGRATLGGKQSYRVLAPAKTGVDTTASATKVFNVYSWYYLSDMKSVDGSGMWNLSTTTKIGGVQFPKSVGNAYSLSKEIWADYNLSYQCRRFEATLGVRDESPSGSVVGFSTTLDSVRVAHGTVALGQRKPFSMDVSGAFRVRLHHVNSSAKNVNDYHIRGVWGDAKVLCLSNPSKV